jgi:hypothetical protein
MLEMLCSCCHFFDFAFLKKKPLTTLAFFFAYEAVEKYRLFLDECEKAVSQDDLDVIFHRAREKAGITSGKNYTGTRKYKSMF